MTKCKLMKGLLGATALTVLSTGTAFAQNDFTEAGETVANTFTLNYEVNDTPQTEINNTGTPTEFNVDRLVNVTVSNPGNTNVITGQENALLPFVVVNNGNDTHAYVLGFEQGGSDQFDTTTATTAPDIIFYEESADTNNDGALSEAERAAATPQSYSTTGTVNVPVLAPDARAFVYIRQDIPTGLSDTNESNVILYADTQTITSAIGAPVTYIETVGDTDGNDSNALTVENVLADLAGGDASAANDSVEDGAHSATGTYIVENPAITASKEVFGVAAGTNGTCDAIPATYVKPTTSTEYHTPNSCVEYIIQVNNAGSTDATDINLADYLPENLTFREAVLRGDTTFAASTPSVPASPTVCDGPLNLATNPTPSCSIVLTGATLPSGTLASPTVGYLVIRATIN